MGLLQIDGDPGWVEASSRPSLPFLRARPPPRAPVDAPRLRLPLVAPRRRRHPRGRRRQPRPVRLRRPSPAHGRRQDVGLAVHRRRPRRALPRPDLPHAPRTSPPPSLHGKGSRGEQQGHHHVRADRRGGHGRQVRARARDTAADRRVRHRGGPGGRRHRARPRAGSAQWRRLARGRALPRGRRTDPGQRRGRRDQHDRGHGRRPLPRPGRPVGLRRGHRPGQRHRAARARRRAAPGHLHAGLRQPELRRGQPRLREHPGHAARGREADPGAGRAARAGDLRHRAPVVREQARRRGPGRRPADVPAVHGHPLRRSARSRPCWPRWWRRSRPAWCGPRSRSGACRCRGWRSRCCSAGTCGSAWRTTSTSAGATRSPTPSSSPTPSRSSRRWAPRWPPRTRRARSSRCGRDER